MPTHLLRCLCREGGRAAAEEGIKYRPAFRDDAHELRHERNRLACEMDFSALFTGYLKTPGRHWLVFR